MSTERSTTVHQTDPWASLASKNRTDRDAERTQLAHDEEGNRIGQERIRLWEEVAAQPLDRLAPQYVVTWTAFADRLRVRDYNGAASALANVANVFVEFRAIRSNWRSELERWYRDHAEPWNKHALTKSQFACAYIDGFSPHRDYAHRWAAEADNPENQYRLIVKRFGFAHTRPDEQRIRDVCVAAELFALVAEHGDSPTEHVTELLADLRDPELVANLALPFAALVFPTGPIVTAFAGDGVPPAASRLGRWFVNIFPDGLRQFVQGHFILEEQPSQAGNCTISAEAGELVQRFRCINCNPPHEFSSEVPTCPRCGADARKPREQDCIVPLVTIHFDPPNAVIRGKGQGVMACTGKYWLPGTTVTGVPSVVTCPVCKETDAFKAAARERQPDDELRHTKTVDDLVAKLYVDRPPGLDSELADAFMAITIGIRECSRLVASIPHLWENADEYRRLAERIYDATVAGRAAYRVVDIRLRRAGAPNPMLDALNDVMKVQGRALLDPSRELGGLNAILTNLYTRRTELFRSVDGKGCIDRMLDQLARVPPVTTTPTTLPTPPPTILTEQRDTGTTSEDRDATLSAPHCDPTHTSRFASYPPTLATFLQLGWDIYQFSCHDGPHHVQDVQQRLADSTTNVNDFNLRLRPSTNAACGVVQFGMPGHEQWRALVNAAHEQLLNLLRIYNPHQITAADDLNATSKALTDLEQAGSGFRLPLGEQQPRMSEGARQSKQVDTSLLCEVSPTEKETDEGSAPPNDHPSITLLRVFTNGLSDDRIVKATQVLADDTLNVNGKLSKIDALIPFPATASAQQLSTWPGMRRMFHAAHPTH